MCTIPIDLVFDGPWHFCLNLLNKNSMIVFLFPLSFSESALPFVLKDLQIDWSFSVTKSSGPYGEATDYFLRGSVKSAVMKSNSSVRFRIKSRRALGHELIHFNVTDDAIDVFDGNLATIAQFKCFRADQTTVFARGMSADQIYAISGLLSASQESIVTITATDSDEVFVIRGSPPPKITNSDLLRKLMPAIAIIFFYGFGKPFQKRFWKQYRQLNTRSLHNRMRETQDRPKKSG
jgi:hypothetical protein